MDGHVAFYGEAAATTANLLSLSACVVLRQRLKRLPAETQERLFPRQMLALMHGDIIFHVAAFVRLLIAMIPDPASVGSPVCSIAITGVRLGRYISVFTETHIAVSFALQSFRQFDLLEKANAYLHAVFPLGVVMVILTYFRSGSMHYDQASGLCIKDHAAMVIAEIISLCFAVSVGAYIAMLRRHFEVDLPNSVAVGNFRRALAYPANFLVTYALMLFVWWTPSVQVDSPQLFWTATTLERLNGFLNTSAYLMQSRYARSWAQQTIIRNSTVDRLSFAAEPSPPSTPRSGSRRTRESRVEFGGVDVVDIAYIGRAARLQSETELRDLAKVTTIVKTWEVTVQRPSGPGGLPLGIRLDLKSREAAGSPVLEITKGGMAEKWNETNPESSIEVGDFVFSVNDKTGMSEMADECRRALVLVIKVSRPA